jgi:hypothetical protein
MRRGFVLVSLVLATVAPAHGQTASFTIRASATFQRLGEWRIDRAPTLPGAVDALGSPTTCRTIRFANHGRAVWGSLGVSVDLLTYGGLPPGRNACTAPSVMRVNWVRVTGRRWITARGLRVGDPVSKLRARYPHAPRNPRGTWPRPRAYWLVTRLTACIGLCEGVRFVTVPQLLAEVRGGRVIALFFHVGAQGE